MFTFITMRPIFKEKLKKNERKIGMFKIFSNTCIYIYIYIYIYICIYYVIYHKYIII